VFPHVESFLVIGAIPGIFVGLALIYASENWDLPWWGFIGVVFGGWLAAFFFAAITCTAIHAIVRRRKKLS
jgi:phosphate/sulfate permease